METEFTDAQIIDADPIAATASAMLDVLGIDDLEVLENTPARFAKAWREMTCGYKQKPEEILRKTFEADCDEMVVVDNIPFASTCKHHLLPFTGFVSIGYIPTGKVVGLSKLPRLVRCFSQRLQMQETMTAEIAHAIDYYLNPLGVGVVVRGTHTCMALRGVKSPGVMKTSSMLGVFRSDPSARGEFLGFLKN